MQKRYIFIPLIVFFLVFVNQVVFASDCCPNPPPCTPKGTATPGFWKNHPEAWPVLQTNPPTEGVFVGYSIYTKEEAIRIMNLPVKGDKTITMFRALVSAVLNTHPSLCNDKFCIFQVIDCANNWLYYNPPESGVVASSDAWQKATDSCPSGEWLYLKLDEYNNGLLCEGHRQ